MIKMGAVGDLIMASSFFEAVRRNFPQSQIAHLVSDHLLPTVKENPNIDRFIPADSDTLYKGGWFSQLREVFRLALGLAVQCVGIFMWDSSSGGFQAESRKAVFDAPGASRRESK